METIKSTIQLVFLPGFFVALMGTYFSSHEFALKTNKNPALYLVDFNISMTLKNRIYKVLTWERYRLTVLSKINPGISGKEADVVVKDQAHFKSLILNVRLRLGWYG